jgi:hypothetical protein
MNYFYFAVYFPSNSILTVMDYFYFLGYFPNKQYFDSNGLFFILQVIFQATVF